MIDGIGANPSGRSPYTEKVYVRSPHFASDIESQILGISPAREHSATQTSAVEADSGINQQRFMRNIRLGKIIITGAQAGKILPTAAMVPIA